MVLITLAVVIAMAIVVFVPLLQGAIMVMIGTPILLLGALPKPLPEANRRPRTSDQMLDNWYCVAKIFGVLIASLCILWGILAWY